MLRLIAAAFAAGIVGAILCAALVGLIAFAAGNSARPDHAISLAMAALMPGFAIGFFVVLIRGLRRRAR